MHSRCLDSTSNPLLASFASLIALLLWVNLSAQVILIATAYIYTLVREGEDRVRERFGAAVQAALDGQLRHWAAQGPWPCLALILLLDQFSRNLHRGSAQAYAADPLALDLCLTAIDAGWEDHYPPERLAFVYMPLMHAESRAMQDLSVAKFTELGREQNLSFARDHREVIRLYGRYPSRNAALGRASTPAERDCLSQPDAGW